VQAPPRGVKWRRDLQRWKTKPPPPVTATAVTQIVQRLAGIESLIRIGPGQPARALTLQGGYCAAGPTLSPACSQPCTAAVSSTGLCRTSM
jgi:hypothetical protein